MLFSCGLSTGLFFYGVSEPIYHYTGKIKTESQRLFLCAEFDLILEVEWVSVDAS